MIDIEHIPSPNFSSREGMDVTGTVIHFTADGPEWNPVKWLTMEAARASAHFVIERDGDIFRLVKLSKKAWHAGVSEMLYKDEMESDAGRFTIGIELANAGLLHRKDDGFYWQDGRGDLRPYKGPAPQFASLVFDNHTTVRGWWEPFPDAQMDALQELLRHLKTIGYGDAAHNLVGHEEIGMPLGRKIDPGPLFPWARFSRKTACRTVSCVSADPEDTDQLAP